MHAAAYGTPAQCLPICPTAAASLQPTHWLTLLPGNLPKLPAGLPMSLAKTKQALLKGYAVAAMSSQDRRAGGGGRCFAWGADASAVVQLVRQLPKQLGLPKGAPVYLDGASSGGSLALRLPLEVEVAGVIGGEQLACAAAGRLGL